MSHHLQYGLQEKLNPTRSMLLIFKQYILKKAQTGTRTCIKLKLLA